MLSIFSSIERIIIAVLIACVIFTSYYAYNTQRNYTQSRKVIENQALKLENSEIQKEYLTQSIQISEKSNAKLLKERESLARINEQYSKDIQVLNAKHIQAQQKIEQLRNSTNEHTKKWANDCVPADAIGLLSHARAASCDANSSTNAVQIHHSTGASN